MFVCEKCNKEFKYNSLLQRHQEKKISCVKYENIINDNIEDLLQAMENIEQQIYVKNKKTTDNNCGYCNTKFSTKSNLTRHLKSCKDKDKIMQYKTNIQDRLYKVIKKQTNDNLKKIKKDKNNININNGNIYNTTNINLNINNFGEEDISYITNEQFLKIIKNKYAGLFEMIKLIHLNENAPFNHNIIVKNKNGKDLLVMKDGKFTTEDKEDIFADLVNNNIDRLGKKTLELNEQITPELKETFNKLQTEYLKFKPKDIDNLNNTINNKFIDNKDILCETFKKHKNK